MKALHVAGLLLSAVSLLGCATSYNREQQAIAGVAVAVVIVGAAIHGAQKNDNKERLAESAGRPAQ